MARQTITFEVLFARWNWKPIRNCPGRYTLLGGVSKLTPAEISEMNLPVFECQSESAFDPVLVVKFKNGGLISYRKSDGNFLHTLNDADGLARKLEQLGIKLN